MNNSIARFLNALNDLERSVNRLTLKTVADTVIKGDKVKFLNENERRKLTAEDRRRANEAVLKSYGLYKEKPYVKETTDNFTLVLYIDFQIKACYAKAKLLRWVRST